MIINKYINLSFNLIQKENTKDFTDNVGYSTFIVYPDNNGFYYTIADRFLFFSEKSPPGYTDMLLENIESKIYYESDKSLIELFKFSAFDKICFLLSCIFIFLLCIFFMVFVFSIGNLKISFNFQFKFNKTLDENSINMIKTLLTIILILSFLVFFIVFSCKIFPKLIKFYSFMKFINIVKNIFQKNQDLKWKIEEYKNNQNIEQNENENENEEQNENAVENEEQNENAVENEEQNENAVENEEQNENTVENEEQNEEQNENNENAVENENITTKDEDKNNLYNQYILLDQDIFDAIKEFNSDFLLLIMIIIIFIVIYILIIICLITCLMSLMIFKTNEDSIKNYLFGFSLSILILLIINFCLFEKYKNILLDPKNQVFQEIKLIVNTKS